MVGCQEYKRQTNMDHYQVLWKEIILTRSSKLFNIIGDGSYEIYLTNDLIQKHLKIQIHLQKMFCNIFYKCIFFLNMYFLIIDLRENIYIQIILINNIPNNHNNLLCPCI